MKNDNPFDEKINKPAKRKIIRQLIQRTKWWVWGTLPTGRRFVLGGYDSHNEAENEAMQKSDQYEVVPLKTVDVNRAVQILKARDINKFDTIEQGIEPVQRG